jgi:hypothetical protein
VSGMSKAVAGLAGLVLAGGACLNGIAAAPVAGAASVACRSCSSLYNQKFGTADVSAVSGGTAAPRRRSSWPRRPPVPPRTGRWVSTAPSTTSSTLG